MPSFRDTARAFGARAGGVLTRATPMLVALALGTLSAGAGFAQTRPEVGAAADSAAAASTVATPASPVTELAIVDLEVGSGTEVRPGDVAYVHYTGWLYDASAPDRRGRQFDSSHDSRIPLGFFVGVGKVIKGWDQGLPGMRVGGKRTLTVPPQLAYGERGMADKVPPDATLIFEIELVDVRRIARKG